MLRVSHAQATGHSGLQVNHKPLGCEIQMLQLRCTRKVLDQFRIPEESLWEPEDGDATLGNWYLNLATIDRRKVTNFYE